MRAIEYGRAICLGLVALAVSASPPEPKGFELKVRTLAMECRDEVAQGIESLIKSDRYAQGAAGFGAGMFECAERPCFKVPNVA